MDVNHVDRIAQQTPLFYAAREGNLEMCRILIDAGCDLAHQDLSHKMASHYAKKYNKNEVYDYFSNEYQNLKDQKKIVTDSKQESVPEEKTQQKSKKKREVKEGGPVKMMYRLYRSDSFGNSTEITMSELEELVQSYP